MSRSERTRRLSNLEPGTRGHVVRVARENSDRVARLTALGVTPGASIVLLQRFPGVVFLCVQTELAVEPAVAQAIVVELEQEA